METLNALPKPEAEKVIARTVEILDRYSRLYSQLSGGGYSDYPSYMASDGFGDEDEFIKPKLFTDFLEQVLEFGRDEYLPEHATAPGVPDFQPVDRLPHPFFFELKGSDSTDLAVHLPQVRRYLKPPFDYGVLTNMRDILVYDAAAADLATPILRVSLLELYRAAKSQPQNLLGFPNTARFLEFVSRFRRQKLDRPAKVERIKCAKDISLLPRVDPDELVVAIRKVVQLLAADARDYRLDLEAELKLPMARNQRQSVAAELTEIARELDRNFRPPAPDQPERFINAREGTIEQRAFDVFLTRVAYFTMIRILLARIWEDVGFIEQQLYDGGFAKWYEALGGRIREVLRHAFGYAAERYDWLYRPRNNYIWYRAPSENVIVDVLYEFARFNLGTLDTDVLGTVYEQFVDRIDRKNKGQYYTPREVIKFIWDRVGFTSDDAFFNYKDGHREPKMVLDVATGSGGFLVEAARRLRTDSGCDHADFNGLLEIMMGITQGLCGCEISLFAHHITEVNLLIQLTPVIREILAIKKEVPNIISALGLSTVPGDSLGLVAHETLYSDAATVADRPRELVPKDPKDPVRQMLTDCNQFDFVCSNPPYVGEKGHKELFRDTLAEHPYWQRHYQGKMDYLYWFIILGLLKLKQGGKLGFITTSYWPTADGASHLREFVLRESVIHEIIDFGETRIFEGAPGQHNIVFVLEKCSDNSTSANGNYVRENETTRERKRKHRIKIVKVKAVPPAKPGDKRSTIARVVEHVSRFVAKERHADEYVDVFCHPETQDKFSGDAWNLFYTRGHAMVLGHVEAKAAPIEQLCELDCGIFSNADYLSPKYAELLPRRRVQEHGIRVGDGIFVIGRELAEALASDDIKHAIVKPTYKNSDIDSYLVVEDETPSYLLYIDDTFRPDEHKAITAHLSKFREVLAARVDRYGEKYPWWRLHRPHSRSIYESEKIVTSRWGKQNVYALQRGGFYENSDINLYVRRPDTKEELRYILALLNSKVLQYWVGYKGRGEGVSRQIRLKNIPIRRIDFKDKADVAMHDKMVAFVDEMIAAKQELAKLNSLFAARLTRFSGPDELPEPDVEAVTRSLKGADLRRVHNHPKVKVRPAPGESFVLARVGEVQDAAELFEARDITELSDNSDCVPSQATESKSCPKPASPDEHMYALRLSGKEKQTTTIFAPKEILIYLKKVLVNAKGKPWSEIRDIPLARDLATYRAREKEVVAQARKLLAQVASLQSRIDALAYKLYGLTEDDIKTIEEA